MSSDVVTTPGPEFEIVVDDDDVLVLCVSGDSSGTSANLTTTNELYVDVAGDDGTGARNKPDKPYLTIGAAVAAALPGDVVNVRPGTYNEKNILKTGIVVRGTRATYVIYTGSSRGGIVDDSATGRNAAIVGKLEGFGMLRVADTSSQPGVTFDNTQHVTIRITNPNSIVTVEAAAIEQSQTEPAHIVWQSDGFLKINAHSLTGTGQALPGIGAAGVRWDSGPMYLNIGTIQTDTGYAFYTDLNGANADAYVTADLVIGSISLTSSQIDVKWWFFIKEHRGGLVLKDAEVDTVPVGKIYYFAEKQLAPGAGGYAVNQRRGWLWYEVQKLTVPTTATQAFYLTTSTTRSEMFFRGYVMHMEFTGTPGDGPSGGIGELTGDVVLQVDDVTFPVGSGSTWGAQVQNGARLSGRIDATNCTFYGVILNGPIAPVLRDLTLYGPTTQTGIGAFAPCTVKFEGVVEVYNSATPIESQITIDRSKVYGLNVIDGTANTPTTSTGIANKSYVDTAVTGLLDFKGTTNCSANPNYPAALKGDFYVVSVAGKIGGASGTSVDAGDSYYATADNAGGTEASVGASWAHVEHNLVNVALTTNTLAQFAATTSAELAGVISDETGFSSGALLVFSISPTIAAPVFTGITVFRQTGGAAGTDEVQISHNGTQGLLECKDGLLEVHTSDMISGRSVKFTQLGGGAPAIREIGASRVYFDGILAAAGSASGWSVDSSGALTASGNKFSLKVLPNTPAQITADQNNYNMTGSGPLRHSRISSDAARNITGFSIGQADGVEYLIYNVGAFNITLKNEDAGSTASNRITSATGADIVMTPGSIVFMLYDGTSSRFRAGKLF